MLYDTKPAELLDVLIQTAYPESALPTDLHHGIIEKVWTEIVRPCLEPASDILDVGAGDGFACGLFARDGHSPLALNYLQADFDACIAAGIRCHRGEMHDLRLLGPFGLVWMRHVLEHSPFPMLALYEAKRVLEPGGWLYVETPAPDTGNRHEDNANHYSVFGARAWRALLVKSGFEVAREDILEFVTQAGPDKYLTFLCRRPE